MQVVFAIWSAVQRAELGHSSKVLSFLGLVEIVFCWRVGGGGVRVIVKVVLQQPFNLGAPVSFTCVSLQLCKVSDSTLCGLCFPGRS